MLIRIQTEPIEVGVLVRSLHRVGLLRASVGLTSTSDRYLLSRVGLLEAEHLCYLRRNWPLQTMLPLVHLQEAELQRILYIIGHAKQQRSVARRDSPPSDSVFLAWVNAAQAFMLMAYIFGMIILVLMVVFRREFRHNANGYDAKKVKQPMFTYIIAGSILFFCCQ